MKSEWRVSMNPCMENTPYTVYRMLDKDGIDHNGNREYIREYFAKRSDAQALAEAMNKEEK